MSFPSPGRQSIWNFDQKRRTRGCLRRTPLRARYRWQHKVVCLAVLVENSNLRATHLMRLLTAYIGYHHWYRIPLSLSMDGPEPRPVHPSACGSGIAVPKVGDLQYYYERRAAREGKRDMASSTSQLGQRVAALEAEVTKLKSQMQAMQTAQPWWEQIAGTLQHDPMYEEAMRLGRQYRQSLRPRKTTQRQK
jgi:hypothetical protein